MPRGSSFNANHELQLVVEYDACTVPVDMPRVNATFIVDCFTTSLPTAPMLRHIRTLYSLRSRYGRKKLFIASRRRIMLAGL